MKRLIIISLALAAIASCIPCPAWAQLGVTPYQNTFWLDAIRLDWTTDTTNSSGDTLTVSAAKYIAPIQINGGFPSIEGKAIFTAGTDSIKGVLYGSNYANGYSLTPRDTMRLFALDSCKLLASGSGVNVTMRGTSFKWVPSVAGKFSIWLTVKWMPLNRATGKITQVTIGRQ
jgi:hypothetical protein